MARGPFGGGVRSGLCRLWSLGEVSARLQGTTPALGTAHSHLCLKAHLTVHLCTHSAEPGQQRGPLPAHACRCPNMPTCTHSRYLWPFCFVVLSALDPLPYSPLPGCVSSNLPLPPKSPRPGQYPRAHHPGSIYCGMGHITVTLSKLYSSREAPCRYTVLVPSNLGWHLYTAGARHSVNRG